MKRGCENSGSPKMKRVSLEDNGGPSASGRDWRRKEVQWSEDQWETKRFSVQSNFDKVIGFFFLEDHFVFIDFLFC